MLKYEKREISINGSDNIMKANSKYIASIEDGKIQIFSFENNELIKVCEKSCRIDIKNIEISKIYYNIFLTVSLGIIDLFEIKNSEENYELDNKLRIETNDEINFAKFSEYNEKILGAISEGKIIKLWNIDSIFNYVTIRSKLSIVTDLIFNKNNSLLMIQGRNMNDSYEILIYDILYNVKNIKIIKRNQKDYIYEISEKNFEKIILVNQFYIEFMDLDKKVIYKKIEINLQIKYICFYKYIQKLIIISSRIPYVIDIKNNKIESSEKNDSKIYNDFFMINKHKFYINILREYYIESFIFDLTDSEKIKPSEKASNNLFSKKFKRIFTKSDLEFTFSDISNGEIIEKSYFKIPKIEEALHNNYSLNLEQKKINVINGIKNYNNEDSANNHYIFLLKLLIQDNTNKDLLKLYLNFLKNNKEFLEKEYNTVENFDCEYSKYKVVFTPDEIKKYFKLEKISEKNEFFNLLLKIKSEQNFDKIIENCNNIYLGLFNQGIEFSSQELYWFRNRELIAYALLKLNNDEKKSEKIKLMKFCIEKINDLKLFENSIILNDYHILTLLMILIVIPLPEEDCIVNLNMIESILHDKNENKIFNNNKILNKNNKFEISNYNQAYDSFNDIIQIEKIKIFLKKILCSNVIKQVFQILYPSYIEYPFKTENDAKNYINKHINFVPFYRTKSNGFTDKFTLDTYIFLKPKNISIQNILNNMLIELLEKILYTSGIIKTNFHELNHNFYNMFYYYENGNIPLKTPRKDGLEFREGGRAMELLLFGKIIHSLNIKQALYILNENNYNKDIYQFKEDFEKLYQAGENVNDYIISGEFSEYNSINNNKELLNKENRSTIYIRLEDSENFIVEYYDYDEIYEGNIFH